MASGDTLVIFMADNYTAPSSDAALPSRRNGHTVLNFLATATANQRANFEGVMPQHYGGSGTTVIPHFSMATATTGNVDLDCAWERVGSEQQDIDSDGFAAVNSQDNINVPTTNGHVLTATGIGFTDGADMDSVAVGEKFRIQITRDAASDTAGGIMELHAIEIRET
jgi:hypothetical protein